MSSLGSRVLLTRRLLDGEGGDWAVLLLRPEPSAPAGGGAGRRSGEILDRPEPAPGQVLLLHGYGGNKEEIMGLGYRLALMGMSVVCPDMPGHGQSGGIFNREQVDAFLDQVLAFMGTGAEAHAGGGDLREAKIEAGGGDPDLLAPVMVGFSVGARLVLERQRSSRAVVAISPPLSAELHSRGAEALAWRRRQRVREQAPFAGLMEILDGDGEGFPPPGAVHPAVPSLLLHAANDLATVRQAAARWNKKSIVVPACSHFDILSSPFVLDQLPRLLCPVVESPFFECCGNEY